MGHVRNGGSKGVVWVMQMVVSLGSAHSRGRTPRLDKTGVRVSHAGL